MIDKSRFNNYGFWVSIAALVPIILQGFGIDILPENYNTIINASLSVLVMMGLINNPTTDCKWFLDDKNNIKITDESEKK
jgi:uncharacterized membrane protein